MGLFSFVGGLIGASKQKKASKKAEAAQLQYLQKALDQQQSQFDTTQANFKPYLDAGTAALGGQQDLLGLHGAGAQGTAISGLEDSPLYEALYRNGNEAILANGAATGGLRGGNMQHSLANFGSDTLAQVIQQQLANLGGLSGQGAASTNQLGNLGAQNSNAVSGLLANQGQVRAGGLLTRGGITASMWNNAGSFADSIASAVAGGGGLGGGSTGGVLGSLASGLFNTAKSPF